MSVDPQIACGITCSGFVYYAMWWLFLLCEGTICLLFSHGIPCVKCQSSAAVRASSDRFFDEQRSDYELKGR